MWLVVQFLQEQEQHLLVNQMTNDALITQTILQAKCTLACWGDNFIQKENGGQDIKCCVAKLTLLSKWIEILEDFYCQFYTLNSSFICLIEDEALELVGKVKIYIKQ